MGGSYSGVCGPVLLLTGLRKRDERLEIATEELDTENSDAPLHTPVLLPMLAVSLRLHDAPLHPESSLPPVSTVN